MASALPAPVRQDVQRNGARDVSGSFAAQRTRHAVAAGAVAAGTGAALVAMSAGAAPAPGTPGGGIGPSAPAAAHVPAQDVAASAGPNAEVEWLPALAFLAVVLGLLALAGLIVHGIWRGIFPRRPAPKGPRYSFDRD